MTRARRTQVSLDATPYYHCISRCVRRAWLCGNDSHSGRSFEHRRQWILDRLRELAEIFAIDVCAYAIMSNHYHVVLHVDQVRAKDWSDQDVIDQWKRLYGGHLLVDRYLMGDNLTQSELDEIASLINTWRDRLHDISWFMRCLNEHIARKSNAEDNCKGRFWEGRFKSQALLDEQALLTCMSYVDLNPIRAGIADTPENSDFTSIQERIKALGVSGDSSEAKYEESYLYPFVGGKIQNDSAGIGFSLNDYLQLVDWTGRSIRDDKKGSIPDDIAPIMWRLGLNSETWLANIKHYNNNFYAVLGTVERIREFAKVFGKRWHRGQGAAVKIYGVQVT